MRLPSRVWWVELLSGHKLERCESVLAWECRCGETVSDGFLWARSQSWIKFLRAVLTDVKQCPVGGRHD